MNSSNQLKAGALLSYVNMAISTIIPLLYTPVMLRILGQAEYGLYSLSNSVISYLSLLTMGLGSTIHRYLMQSLTANDKQMLEKTTGLFVVIYAVIAGATLLIGSGMTAFTGLFFAKGLTPAEIEKLNILIVIMTVSAAVSLLAVPFGSVIVCYERYVFQKVLFIIMTIALPLLNIAVLYAGMATVGMALVSVALQLVMLAVNIWYFIRKLGLSFRFRGLPWHLLREIFTFTFFVFIAMIADLLYWATDKVLIGALVGSTAVAVYNVGATFNSMLNQLSSAISGVFGPRINKLVFSHSPMGEISELLIRVGRIQYLVVSLALSGFIVFGRAFVLLWAGPEYEEAYYVALLTLIPLSVPMLQNIAYNTIVAMNKHRFRSILYIVLAVMNVVGTYLLIPYMGITGAALCTFVVYIIGHGTIMNWFYYRKIGLDIPGFWNNIIRLTAVPGVMAAVCLLIQRSGMEIENIYMLAGGILVYTAVFCLLSWLFSMNGYEKKLVWSMISKVIPRRHGN